MGKVEAYKGDEPYVFVCYSHVDSGVVYDDLVMLGGRGVRAWYDEGISAGARWRAEIAGALEGSSRLIFYVSPASLGSPHCQREVDFALDRGVDILPVYLEPCELPSELALSLGSVQALFRYDDERYADRLVDACLAAPGVARRVGGHRPPARRRGLGWPVWVGGAVALGAINGGIIIPAPSSSHRLPV